MNVFKRKRLIWVQIIIKNWIIENGILELWLALAIVVYEMIIANSYRNAHSWDNCSVEDKVRLLRLVLFPILLFFRLPSTIIFIAGQRNTRNYSTPISEMLFTFLREELFEKNFCSWMTAKHSQNEGAVWSSACKRREFWRETHTPLWLLIGGIIFLTREKPPFAILIGRIIFFARVKTIVRSFDWLELISLWFST